MVRSEASRRCCSLRRARQRRAARRRRAQARRRPVQPIYVSVGLAWEAEELAMRRPAARARRRLADVPAAGDARRSTCATSIRRPTGRSAASRPASTRPTKTSTSKAATSSCSRRRRSSWRGRGLDARAARPARRQSVSGRDADVLRRHGARAVARARRADRDRGAVRGAAQGRRDQAWESSWACRSS